MVELAGRARGRVVDTSVVELERGLTSIDGNRDRSLRVGSQEIVFVSGWDVGVFSKGGTSVSSVVLASVGRLHLVWVGLFSVNSSVLDDVVHGVGHQTSVASHVTFSPRAVHQVLFGESNKAVSGKLVASFDGSGGGERPARTALSLVLNSSDDSFLSPVKFSWDGSHVDIIDEHFTSISLVGLHVETVVELLEFSVAQVSEFVEGNGESVVRVGIVLSNEVIVILEGLVSVQEFDMVIRLLVLLHPVDEFGGIIRRTENKSDKEEKENKLFHYFFWI